MTETITINREELARLEESARKCAMYESCHQLVMRLINSVGAASGLEESVDSILRHVQDIMGGADIILYYWIDDDIFSADVHGRKTRLDSIDDDLVRQVASTREQIEVECPFNGTKMPTPEFAGAFTWVYPLAVGTELIGVFKMENLQIGMREMHDYLSAFFSFTSLVLRNEILGHTRLKKAYDELSETNNKLANEIVERERAQEGVLKAKEELEQWVEARTLDMEAKRDELEDTQKALMNIVEDLNEKTEELEHANLRLKELDRLKSMFIASMSHELRTPLNSIIGFSSILHDEWLGPVTAEQKENLAIILQSGRLLLNLINDVIDVSKIEAGKIESVAEEFELRDLIVDAVNQIKREQEEKGLDLHVASVAQIMYTDRRRLLQCVLNLLTNAVKYTEKGSVTVETRIVGKAGTTPETGIVEISVTDTGIGIDNEGMKRLFQPFVRLGSSTMAIVPGTGLGLYLSRKLAVEVLKGDITVTSEFGRGSRFTLRIPARLS